ncbi:MAG: Maf family protein, partial [Dermatophilaceae bacterium]
MPTDPAALALILASASPARLATLQSAGVEPIVRVSSVDEAATVADAERAAGTSLAAEDVALLLARAKAEDVVAALAGGDHASSAGGASSVDGGPASSALVLGCDTVLEFDDEVHGKPADPAEAMARWRRMRGRSARVHTGHWLVDT